MTEKQRVQIVDRNGVITHRHKRVAATSTSTARVAALSRIPKPAVQPFSVEGSGPNARLMAVVDTTNAAMRTAEKQTDELTSWLFKFFDIRDPGAATRSKSGGTT